MNINDLQKENAQQYAHHVQSEFKGLTARCLVPLLLGCDGKTIDAEVNCAGGIAHIVLKPAPGDSHVIVGAKGATMHALRMLYEQLAKRLGVKLDFHIDYKVVQKTERFPAPVKNPNWPVAQVEYYLDQLAEALFDEALVNWDHGKDGSKAYITLGPDEQEFIPFESVKDALSRVMHIHGKIIGHELTVAEVKKELPEDF